MSNIDYVKNVQIYKTFDGTTNEIKYNVSGFPMNDPPDVCIIKQINFMTDDVDTNIYSIWSDLVNDHVASFTTTNNYEDEKYNAIVCPNTTIKLNRPVIGDITFSLLTFLPADPYKLQPIADTNATIVLNLEFIRYNKN